MYKSWTDPSLGFTTMLSYVYFLLLKNDFNFFSLNQMFFLILNRVDILI
jgi:hypothetical protein